MESFGLSAPPSRGARLDARPYLAPGGRLCSHLPAPSKNRVHDVATVASAPIGGFGESFN
jgi:hypothetical protein